jgi:hypothetical protein
MFGMRHSDSAAQLPTSASGNRLCRHTITGSCTRWCSYKLFTKVIVFTVLVLALICAAIWLTGGDEGHERVRDVLYGVAIYLAIVVPSVALLNNGERE